MVKQKKNKQKCGICKDIIGCAYGIMCNKCNMYVHCRSPCSDVTASTYEEKGPSFICIDCIASYDKSTSIIVGTNASPVNPSDENNIDKIRESLRDTPNDTKELVRAIEFLADKFDELISLVKRVDKIEMDIKAMSTKSGRLSRSKPVNSHPSQNEVIISRVPEVGNENSKGVAMVLFDGLEADISAEDIEEVTRFSRKGEDERLFMKVRFTTHQAKMKAIKASKQKKATMKHILEVYKNKNKNKELNVSQDASDKEIMAELKLKYVECKDWKVFINENVSKRSYELLKMTLELKKSGTIVSTWTFNNKVYYKVKADDKPIAVNKSDDLLCLQQGKEGEN